jgi:hypothetical protein
VIDFLKPQADVEELPADPHAARYVRSYLTMRFCVGVLGIALPLVLIFVDGLVFDEHPFPRNSLSAYYYSGTRDLFVGTLLATAIFLITYKISERGLDGTFSTVAGLAAVFIALCPMKPPSHDVMLTPLQAEFGEKLLAVVHMTSATVFIGSLGVICFFFGKREAHRPVVGWVIATQIAGRPRTSLLIGRQSQSGHSVSPGS